MQNNGIMAGVSSGSKLIKIATGTDRLKVIETIMPLVEESARAELRRDLGKVIEGTATLNSEGEYASAYVPLVGSADNHKNGYVIVAPAEVL